MDEPPMSAIVGVGIDIVEISRIARAMEDDAFPAVVLTPAEQTAECTAEWLAGRWAAKEAVAKAVGTHMRWHDVEIHEDGRGKPIVFLHGPSRPVVHLTLAIGGGLAGALAIAEAVQEGDSPR